MLSNHNPHRTCTGFHHRHSLSLMQKNGKGKRGKKNYIDLFLPPFQAFPLPPRSLSSTFVDKSHICVSFWRLLIVLNRRNYSQGVAAAAEVLVAGLLLPILVQSLALCFVNLKYPPQALDSPAVLSGATGRQQVRLHLTSTAPGLVLSSPPQSKRR